MTSLLSTMNFDTETYLTRLSLFFFSGSAFTTLQSYQVSTRLLLGPVFRLYLTSSPSSFEFFTLQPHMFSFFLKVLLPITNRYSARSLSDSLSSCLFTVNVDSFPIRWFNPFLRNFTLGVNNLKFRGSSDTEILNLSVCSVRGHRVSCLL